MYWKPSDLSNVLLATDSLKTALSAKNVDWPSVSCGPGVSVRSSCGSSTCLLTDLGYSLPWNTSQTKLSRSISLDVFDDIESTERFIAYRNEFGSMAIKPASVSEMWNHILEGDWWYMFDERPELEYLFERIKTVFEEATNELATDILDVSLDVAYSFKQPPGIKALQWGHHMGTTKDGHIFKAAPLKESPKQRGQLTFVTGFVRTITMETLG